MEKPILQHNTPKIIQMKSKVAKLKQLCNSSFHGQANWRDKASLKKKLVVMKKEVQIETQRITDQYEKDLKEYEYEMESLKLAELAFQEATPISSISLSDPVEEMTETISDEDAPKL